MGPLFGVIQATFAGVATVLDKKVFAKRTVGADWQTLFQRITNLVFLIPLFWFGILKPLENGFEPLVSGDGPWLLACSMALLYATYPLRRAAVMNEKVTVLQPFALSKNLFCVIFAFAFIPAERGNPWPFAFSVLALAILIGSQAGKSGIKFNRWTMSMLGGMFLLSIQSFFTLKFVKEVGGTAYYFAESFVILGIVGSIIAFGKQRRQAKQLDRRWVGLASGTAAINLVASLIVMEMYRAQGMVASSLLQLLYVAFVFAFSFFFLGERPTRKDLLVSALVTGCVAAGFLVK